MTADEFASKVQRTITKLRRAEEAVTRDHLRTLERIRQSVGGQVNSPRAAQLVERAAEVLAEKRAAVDADFEKTSGKLRQEIADVVRAASPVSSENEVLAAQLRGAYLLELQPLFDRGDTEAMVSRLRRLRREGAALEEFVLLTVAADLHAAQPHALPAWQTGAEIELLKSGPPELRAARQEAEQLEQVWRRQGEAPWNELVGLRPKRDETAAQLLAKGEADMIRGFDSIPPPVGFGETAARAATAEANAAVREMVARSRGGGRIEPGADVNAAIRQATGRAPAGDE